MPDGGPWAGQEIEQISFEDGEVMYDWRRDGPLSKLFQ
jgi:hypothetical protein